MNSKFLLPVHPCHVHFPFLQCFILHSFLHILLAFQSCRVSPTTLQSVFIVPDPYIVNSLLFFMSRDIHGTCILHFFCSLFAILFSTFYSFPSLVHCLFHVYNLFSCPRLMHNRFPYLFPRPEPSVVFAFFLSSILYFAFFSPHSISSPVTVSVYSTSTSSFHSPRNIYSKFLTFPHRPVYQCHLLFSFLHHFLRHLFLPILLASQSHLVSAPCSQSAFLSPAQICLTNR
jgi:hypothetical protein